MKQEDQTTIFPEEVKNSEDKVEKFVQECLRQIYTASNEDDAIEQALAGLGRQFCCDRVCILRVRSDQWVNMESEWCREGVLSQKDNIKNEPVANFRWKPGLLDHEDVALLRDIEDVRNIYPSFYAMMKSWQVRSMIVIPLSAEQYSAAVIHMENPDLSISEDAMSALQQLRQHIAIQLKRRDMLRQLEEMSFHDPLTGAFNRNALTELYQRPLQARSVGVIYCDVSGLKQVNDTKGHEEGDEMIIQCCQLICRSVRTDKVYRMGGDEFLALCFDSTKEDVEHDFEVLKGEISKSRHHIAAGLVWSDEQPLMLEELIAAADHEMYLDKQEYYSTRDYFARMANDSGERHHAAPDMEENTAFQKYIKNYYFDAEAFLKSITVNNTNQFFYFGDIKKNYFYISDSMRDRFGFESNLLLNLPHHWEQRICGEEYKRINSKMVERLFCEKLDTYELLHQLQDAHGNRIWVHNSGTLQWNTDRTVPLFLSGRVTLIDKDYSIDQITGFQKDYKALIQLEEMHRRGEQPAVIGFCLNHFSKINDEGGTYYGNMLFYHIGNRLRGQLRSKMTFYRLDGTCCMAILEPEYAKQQEELLNELRRIIEEEYRAIEVYDQNPASYAMLHYTRNMETPQEFLETVSEMLDTAKNMPNLPYVTASDEQKREIEQMGQMAATLRKNVQNEMENFRILVQPVVYAGTTTVTGGEALLRWNYDGKDILPAQLIPLLEAEGLLAQVDRWVIRQTVSSAARIKNCTRDFHMGFNVSDQALQSEGFTDFLRDTMSSYNMEGRDFYVEIEETHILRYREAFETFADVCRKMKIDIRQKGFGALTSLMKAGMDAFSDSLKLNISMLDELNGADQDKYLQSLSYLCHKFGKNVCITGTEERKSCKNAAACGCDYVQGYCNYHPMELSELYALMLANENG